MMVAKKRRNPEDDADMEQVQRLAAFIQRHPDIAHQVIDIEKRFAQAGQDLYHRQLAMSFLKAIEQEGRLLTIHTEVIDGVKFFNIHGTDAQHKTIAVPGTDILEALQYFNGHGGPVKTCGKCGLDKPLYMFSKLKTKKDGRNIYCKMCERERVRQHNRQKHLRRKCRKCKVNKLLTAFPKDAHQPKGRGYYCNQCRRVRKGRK